MKYLELSAFYNWIKKGEKVISNSGIVAQTIKVSRNLNILESKNFLGPSSQFWTRQFWFIVTQIHGMRRAISRVKNSPRSPSNKTFFWLKLTVSLIES